MKQAKLETLQQERRAYALEKENDGYISEISNLKKELLRKDKLMEDRVKQANQATASLSEQKIKLEKQIYDLNERIK